MKILARIGALLSFVFFFIPGAWCLANANKDEALAKILGSCLIGVAFFLGTILWVVGEKCCAKKS